MPFFGKSNLVLILAAWVVAASGCSPMDQGPGDEEKEPHYVLGKSRVNAMDYPGAIEAFEQSLEANPHSAAAHYQLAMLYENQESDPAAAIYHYQQYLKYDPKADNADLIAQHIATCKQELAENVLQLPSTPAVQQQLEKLTEENRRLRDQLAQWQAYYAAQQAAKANLVTPQSSVPPQPQASQTQDGSVTPDDVTSPTAAGAASIASARPAASPRHISTPERTSAPRTHIVATGDTLAGIARRHGISLDALEAANPGVNPRKLKAGQVLNLPAQ